MDLQWRVARMRAWIDLGFREALTYQEVARRAGVSARTVRRWCQTFRRQAEGKPFVITSTPEVEGIQLLETLSPSDPVIPEAGSTFAEVLDSSEAVEPPPSLAGQVQIELSGGARVVISGPLDVETLSRVIEAVKQC